MTLRAILVLLGAFCLAGCPEDYAIRLQNSTGVPLTYVPVVTDPPPPHREISTRQLQPNTSGEIDPTDFNPLFWDPVSKLGLIVQMDLENSPAMILVRVYQYKVAPGQEGTDPALQPTSLHDEPLEIAEGNFTIGIRAGPIAGNISITYTQAP